MAALGWLVSAQAAPTRENVMALLDRQDPVAERDLRALGEGVDTALRVLASDTSVPLTRRARAIAALGYFQDELVRAFLERQIAPTNELVLRQKAATSLAAFGPSAVPRLAGLLADPDPRARIAAANALALVEDPTSVSALEARLRVESEPAVRDALLRAAERAAER